MFTQSIEEIDKGKLLFECKWGEAKFNGMHLRNCVHLANYEKGILISMMPINYFGELWLPRKELVVGSLQERKRLVPESRLIKTNEHEVVLLGRLAKSSI